MIKLENVVLASPEQMDFIIEGMRNPMNSWDRSDSYIGFDCTACGHVERDGICKRGIQNESIAMSIMDLNSATMITT